MRRSTASRAHALLATLFATGCRVSEILTAQVEDVGEELGQRTLRLHRKGGYVQRIVLPESLATLLEDYLDGRASGPIFRSRTGSALDRTAVSRLLHRLAHETLPPRVARQVHPHTTRIAALGLAFDAGQDPLEIMRRAGHRRFSTTLRYWVRFRELTHAVPALVDLAEVAGTGRPSISAS